MRKIFLSLFLIMLLSFGNSLAQERVEVITPEKIETTQTDITYPIPHIPVLRGLNYQPGQSALLKTGSILTGMLVFKGNFKPASLVEFYRTQMKAQGWEEIGSFTSKTTFLAFRRPDGQAFISISEGWTSTEVRLIVFLTGVK